MAGRRKTHEERKADAKRKLDKADALVKKAKNEIAAIEAKEKKQQRKDEEHTKFIYGGAVKAMMEQDDDAAFLATLKQKLETYTTRKDQREFMGYAPSPASPQSSNNNGGNGLSGEFPKAGLG